MCQACVHSTQHGGRLSGGGSGHLHLQLTWEPLDRAGHPAPLQADSTPGYRRGKGAVTARNNHNSTLLWNIQLLVWIMMGGCRFLLYNFQNRVKLFLLYKWWMKRIDIHHIFRGRWAQLSPPQASIHLLLPALSVLIVSDSRLLEWFINNKNYSEILAMLVLGVKCHVSNKQGLKLVNFLWVFTYHWVLLYFFSCRYIHTYKNKKHSICNPFPQA